ncbi:endonuclease/exonuclease/phosphatase family protein [Jannaschia sp. W003]|uniref:endonuclease/exonuclease/phosphatase family protein n=1 Tax=Jannaschia sp. W003 TaxID=2867012 RepID=UPI0021A6403B|nr:endonuclease/exonuclease/phosphatase family protein [Jannaschia sp. W003]UWQ21977.1 endonuclease/exonuclease/phosphatase family protein [Jannaschia sp. W003]
MRIEVASWNLRFAWGTDMRPSAGRIVDALGTFGADVVCLQEAEARFGRRSSLPLGALSAMGWRPVHGGLGPGLGWRGNAVLLRGGWRADPPHHLSLRGWEVRGAVLVRLHGPEGALSLACVHLGLAGWHRRAQLRAVHAALEAMPGPHAIVGDTNEWRAGGLALPDGWTMAAPGPTYPSRRPVFPLDRVLAGPGLRIEGARVVAEGFDRRASDHLPVAATLVGEGTPRA